jgi:hypothetical protein
MFSYCKVRVFTLSLHIRTELIRTYFITILHIVRILVFNKAYTIFKRNIMDENACDE